MSHIDITLQQLRQMIGVRVRYMQHAWQVVEVLEDGPSVVLENLQRHRIIQRDQYGEGYRRVPHRMSVPVLSRDRQALHPEFLDLELI